MSTEINSSLNEAISNLENLEESQVQASQKKILEELYTLRESLSKIKPGNEKGSEITLNELYSLRDTLKEEIMESRKMQDLLMRRSERVGHLKKNFKKIFDVKLILIF